MSQGVFVVIDGVDGAGKSTQVSLLQKALEQRGHLVHTTCEPSTLPVGVLLREYLRGQRSDTPPSWAAMALLFAADRLQHVRNEIEPKLAEGAIVLCDRYDASSIAYQSATAPANSEAEKDDVFAWVASVNRYARRPDLTLFLDLDPEIAAERRQQRGQPEELFEQLDLQKRIRQQYAKIASVRPHDRIVLIDARQDLLAVHEAMIHAFDRHLLPSISNSP